MFNFEWTNDTLQYGLFEQRNSFWQGSDMEAKGCPKAANWSCWRPSRTRSTRRS